jgi:uncharacterized membrane protein
MISLRLAVPAVLVAAAVAGCFTYFVTSPPAPPLRVEADQPSPQARQALVPMGTPRIIDHRISEKERADAFQEAAEAILKRAPDAKASARNDEPSIAVHIPLPKRRPILRP